MSMAAFIGRTFSMDPVAVLQGSPHDVALRLAAANQVLAAIDPKAEPWGYADGMPAPGEG